MSEDPRIPAALKNLGFQPTSVASTDKTLRVTLRVPPNSSAQWVLCFRNLLIREAGAPWSVDVSRKYFVRDPNAKVLYIWRLIFEAPVLADCVPDIVDALSRAPKAKVEVKEIQLAGSRGGYANGKGAQSIRGDEGVPSVAQMAMARLRGG